MPNITRRQFLAASAAVATSLIAPSLRAIATSPAGERMGLAINSYDARLGGKVPSDKYPGWTSALQVLDHCQELGAGGMQAGVRAWKPDFAAKVRSRCESLGLFLEGQISLPRKPGEVDRFESEAAAARLAGATVLRTACGGRRYEDLNSADDFRKYRENAWAALALAEPVVRRLGMKLAIENHKDWRVDELLDTLKHIGSDHVGVTLDVGNSIALLEDPMHVIEALVPHALTVHFKNMAVMEYEQGFLLSEVPLGQGILDLPAIVATCRRANPAIRFMLEMITRDPLKIPCLTDKYWTTLQAVPGADLARTLSMVRARAAKSLPHVTGLTPEQHLELEESQVRRSFGYAQAKLGL